MALQKRESFSQINIKTTEEGVCGELKTYIEIYDDVSGVVESSQGHRQVVPLDDTTKVVNTPSGSRSVADIIGSINADIAATNLALVGERNSLKQERDNLLGSKP